MVKDVNGLHAAAKAALVIGNAGELLKL